MTEINNQTMAKTANPDQFTGFVIESTDKWKEFKKTKV